MVLRRRLALLACAGLIAAGCGGGGAAASGGSGVVTSPSESTSTSPTASPIGSGVVLNTADVSAFARGQIGDVIRDGTGFLAVGYVARADNAVEGAVWRSADGRTWTMGPHQDSFLDRLLTDVVAVPTGFVAAGQTCGTGGGECGGISVWHSLDGTTWKPGTVQVATDADCCNLEGLAASANGVVGVASDLSDVSSGPKDALGYVSADGVHWVAHRRDPVFKDAEASAVIAGGPGVITVGGHSDGTFAAWASADGTDWTADPPPAGLLTGEARDVIAAGPGFVAIGRDGADAAAWTSTDGLAWTRVAASEALKAGRMNRVALVGSTLLAVGYAGFGAAAWTSSDGLAWTRAPDQPSFDGAEMTSIAAAGSTVVVFGKRSAGGLPGWIVALP